MEEPWPDSEANVRCSFLLRLGEFLLRVLYCSKNDQTQGPSPGAPQRTERRSASF